MLAPILLAAVLTAGPQTLRGLRPEPGDVVLLENGRYDFVWNIRTTGVEYRSPSKAASFRAIVLTREARRNVLDGIRQSGSPLSGGIVVRGDENTIRNCRVEDNRAHGIHLKAVGPCPPGDEACLKPPTGNRVEECRITRNGDTGLRLEAGFRNTFIRLRVDRNLNHGAFERPDVAETVIADCEIDHNGSSGWESPYHHSGLYLKGRSGRVTGNRIHHQPGYGIACWAACYGTPDKPYVIMDNEVYRNESGGVVIAGTWKEASPPGDGYPRYIRYQHNSEWNNGRRSGGRAARAPGDAENPED